MKKKKKYRRTNSRQFDRIFVDTPVSPPFFDRWIPAAGIPRRKIRRDSAAAYHAPRVQDSGYSGPRD